MLLVLNLPSSFVDSGAEILLVLFSFIILFVCIGAYSSTTCFDILVAADSEFWGTS